MMYWIVLALLTLSYAVHYSYHGHDQVELVSYVTAVVALFFLAYKEWRASK